MDNEKVAEQLVKVAKLLVSRNKDVMSKDVKMHMKAFSDASVKAIKEMKAFDKELSKDSPDKTKLHMVSNKISKHLSFIGKNAEHGGTWDILFNDMIDALNEK